MPIFTIPIQSQNQVTKFSWPKVGEGLASQYMIDQFSRENLNPTGLGTLYTVNIVGAGTGVINAGLRLRLTTSATANDSVDTRYEIMSNRAATFIGSDSKSQVSFDFIFAPVGTIVNYRFFVGVIASSTNAITALPTTVGHLGVFVNTTTSNNFFLSSGNNTAQVTTDTGTAISVANFRLNILWNGANTATISLFSSGNNFSTLIASQTVTSVVVASMRKHFYVETPVLTFTATMDFEEWLEQWN